LFGEEEGGGGGGGERGRRRKKEKKKKKRKEKQLFGALGYSAFTEFFHKVVCIQVTYTVRFFAVTGQIKKLCNVVIIVLHLGKPQTHTFFQPLSQKQERCFCVQVLNTGSLVPRIQWDAFQNVF
jgi:hypothetical protein